MPRTPVRAPFQPQRLAIAREFRGRSLVDLGAAVGSSRQFIALVEKGERSPSRELVDALAATLGFAPIFFERPVRSRVNELSCFFRKPAKTPLTERRRVAAYAALVDDLMAYFERHLEIEPVRVPRIEARFPLAVEEAASACRSAWGVGLDAPISNMARLLERAGVVVTEFGGVPNSIDALSWYGPRPVVVRSSEKTSSSRARFDLAHECGHLVLHRDRPGRTPEMEAEADKFAGSFLLPAAAFAREFPKQNSYIDWAGLISLKARWKVSLSAMIRRAYDLQLIDAARYRSANVYLRMKKWHRGEPGEPAPDEPELIGSCFAALEPEGLSASDVTGTLGWGEDVLPLVVAPTNLPTSRGHAVYGVSHLR